MEASWGVLEVDNFSESSESADSAGGGGYAEGPPRISQDFFWIFLCISLVYTEKKEIKKDMRRKGK